MSQKKGAGGRLQNYDWRGRYSKTSYGPPPISNNEKRRRRKEARRQSLFCKAKKTKDKYLFETFLALQMKYLTLFLMSIVKG